MYAGRKGNNNIVEISALRPGRESSSLVHPYFMVFQIRDSI